MSSPTSTDERHRRLDLLVGAWRTEITMLDDAGNEGERYTATDTYRWMAGGFFLLHDVEAEMADGEVRSLELIGVEDDHYVARSYDSRGGVTDYTARVDGPDWRIESTAERFSGRFNADWQQLSGRWERADGARWLPWMLVTLTRIDGP